MQNLQHKNVIVTGGTHGIGERTARYFSELGANVLIIGRDETQAQKIIEASPAGSIKFVKCELSVRTEVLRLVDRISREDTVYDILINNASRNSRFNILNIKEDEWDSMLELNLTVPMLLSRCVAQKLIRNNKPGHIINIGAVQSFFPLDSSLAYSTVKGGLRSLTKSMAVDLAPYGILVTLVMPGPIYAKGSGDTPSPELDSRSAALIPRMGRTIEVAKLLAFLASDDNSFMTGNEIIIDGGRTVSRKPDPEEIKEDVI
ncbi:MAG: SDR family oxidoreductase [Thermoplasmataceae archaeon]